MDKRRLAAQILFVLNALVCGVWGYREVSWLFDPPAGSGGIGGVSSGLLGVLVTIVPPVVTIALARMSGSTLAKWWRNAHLIVTLALIIVPMAVSSVIVLVVSILVFPPVTVFFVVGAVAIWFANPRKLPPAESPA
jgi:hypothetical protein